MRLIVTKLSVGLYSAAYIRRAIQAFAPTPQKPFVLGLPTGSTVLDMYAILRTFAQERLLSFQHVTTFNMDEYVGLPEDHPQSYHSYMRRNLFNAVHLPPQQIFIPNGNAPDLQAECTRYEQAIAKVGGIRLLVGGVGRNGHIAFNEPGTPFNSRTHVTQLAPSTLAANARFFQHDVSRVPRQALSMGIGTILDARELLFIASGVKKAAAVSHLISQEPTLDWPLTALKLHPQATLLADLDACVLLSGEVKNQLDNAMQQDPHAEEWVIPIGEQQ
ncbi:MAG: glucosamine-6-phosphate deaminase [Elusimicrobiaceae bacterium]|nr:glucosamine-6-phosphate deaminase [Elusimicrobiaceae bacterium]